MTLKLLQQNDVSTSHINSRLIMLQHCKSRCSASKNGNVDKTGTQNGVKHFYPAKHNNCMYIDKILKKSTIVYK